MSFGAWLDVIAPAGSESGFGTALSRSILKAIVELGPDWKGTATLGTIDSFTSRDIKKIESMYNGEKPGVQEPTTVTCPHCENEFMLAPIDWVTDFFVMNAA